MEEREWEATLEDSRLKAMRWCIPLQSGGFETNTLHGERRLVRVWRLVEKPQSGGGKTWWQGVSGCRGMSPGVSGQ